MKKTYWWRILSLLISASFMFAGYLMFYPYKYSLCDISTSNCIFSNFKKTVAEPLFLNSISFILISLFLFFVSDFVFKKWLKFAIFWIIITVIFVALAPVSSTQVIGNPTKESVSIWMSSLFVIISFIQLIVLSKKQKKG